MTELPRLLFFSDVFAEASYSGALLMHRLLEDYPAGRLLALEPSHAASAPPRRLPQATYARLEVGDGALAFTRVHAWWHLWMTTRSSAWSRLTKRVLGDFQPDAVLTVLHGHAWAAAAAYASSCRLPLHLIVHDDWPRMVSLPRLFADRVDNQVKRIYPQAASRLCVSPWMAAAYEDRYGAAADVLYPSRGRTSLVYDSPPERLNTQHPMVVGFGGTIRAREHFQLLGTLASVLRSRGGRVIVYGPISAEHAAREGAGADNIEFRGMVDQRALADRLRAEADVLLVPTSFDPIDEANMRVCFPSKVVDYTAIGLPLLICGPEYSSAVQWARRYGNVAEVLVSTSPSAVSTALDNLASSPERRMQLGRRALEVGRELFDHQAAWSVFTNAVRSKNASGQNSPQ